MSVLPPAAQRASPIERADAHVLRIAGGARHHPVVRIAGALSEVADQPPLILLSSATLAAGLLLHRPRLARAGGRMLASHLLATFAKTLIKNRIDRTRPHLLMDNDEYRMAAGDSEKSEERSFPSGHTAGAVAVTRAFAREYDRAVVPAAVVAGAVAAIQVPRCKHYPSDLAAGAVIGWLAEAAVDHILRRLPSVHRDATAAEMAAA